jgi:hypothetical protein
VEPVLYWSIAAAAVLAIAAYAQSQVGHLIAIRWQAHLIRGLLAFTGGLFGFAAASDFRAVDPTSPTFLIFLTGLGAVHVPAAAILFFKRRRGESKS